MKVWLNNLKPGDKFWTYDWKGPREVEIVGQDIDPSFIMPRWKLNDGTSTLVNRYVFTTKEEAINDYLPKLKEKLSKLEEELAYTKIEIDIYKEQIDIYEKYLN